jgi:glycosyltransferase involved in cell wall biosynthesis
MTSRAPLVSVSMVTYNHEQYIAEAIESVRRQTFTDWELIIVNDGSVDATSERVRAFDDPRLVLIEQINQGPGAATNRAIAASRGKYLALMSGDDVCFPDRLAAQLRAYDSGERRVLFGEVDFINDRGERLDAEHFAASLFETETRTRAQILERFFTHGNFLNGVTVFAEREIFLEAGPYDESLFQLQDFEMWIRLLKRYQLSIVPGRVTKYRIHDDNLSRPDIARAVRSANELYVIMRRFFDGLPAELFHEAFDDRLVHPACDGALELRCEQAFLYLKSPFKLNQLIGIERLHDLLRDADGAEVLNARYGFTSVSFAETLKNLDVMNQFSALTSSLYVDTGRGFNDRERLQALPETDARAFRIRFDMRGIGPVRSARWDLPRRSWRSVLLTNVWCDGANRRGVAIDLAKVATNGAARPDGSVAFRTLNPSFILPVEGDFTALTVQGEWDRGDAQGDAGFTRTRQEETDYLESRFAQTLQREREELATQYSQRLQRETEHLASSFAQTLQREREDFESRLAQALQREHAELESRFVERLQREKGDLESVLLGRLEAEKRALRAECQRQIERVSAEHEEARRAEHAELETVLHSRSWRMTAALRAIRRRIERTGARR